METTADTNETRGVPKKRGVLKKLAIGLGAVVGVLVVVVATRPATYHIERSISVSAPPEVVFARVNDFHAWSAWSPWAKVDPAMKQAYEGAPSGEGAVYTWAGNNDVGEGKMTIAKSDKPSQVRVNLEFYKPMASTSTATFTFTPGPDGTTKVTWAMDGENNFAGKAVSLFLNIDKVLGAQFEQGLAAMKSEAEAASARAENRP